jgi:prepilin-type N-terminal cleavage/methylation domain-containing protein
MRNRNGYTLLEMILVIAIILILSLAAYPGISGYLESRQEQYRQNQEYVVNKALMQYYAMTGRYYSATVNNGGLDIDGDSSDEALLEDTDVEALFKELRNKTGATVSAGDYEYWSRNVPASVPGTVSLTRVYVDDK